jgi:uncharacterized membrane protein
VEFDSSQGSILVRSDSTATAFVPPWWQAIVALSAGCALTTSAASTWLSQRAWATMFVSPSTWESLPRWLSSGRAVQDDELTVAFVPLLGILALVTATTWFGGAIVIARRNGIFWTDALRRWGRDGWLWWCALGAWEWLWIAVASLGWNSAATMMEASIPFWVAICLSGWFATAVSLAASMPVGAAEVLDRTPRLVWLLAGIYVTVFVTMNWRLWFNLYVPHGDSAMYEEHLWNLLHGKGFRSYLDQGLFLGEHVQVVHMGLTPLYVLWPSHLLLELCESVALAAGAFPVAWMTQRHTRSNHAALCAAAAYLLYFPLQFLDIEIDLKTFRPEAFGIPILLLTLDQLDRGRWRGFVIGLLACLTVKEDYSLVLGPLGVWVAFSEGRHRRWGSMWFGIGLAIFSVLYLWLATRVIMPWFRPGEEIHYTRYFSQLGDTPEAIVRTIVTRPGFVAGQLLTSSTWLYALALLVPVGGISLLSPGRLAVGLPLFGVLCLNELARDPRHHFHAPLVSIVFWATATGLENLPRLIADMNQRWRHSSRDDANVLRVAGHWLWASALCAGLFFSLSPLGLAFWDPGSNWHWRKLYGPNPRGVEFAKVASQIPLTARVASTDFVHPRFTHHERSYDYSGYVRKVSGYEQRVPDDTEFIVIDATHPYSRYHLPDDVPEFHQPERWELLPDRTNGHFIVLRRR